MNGTITRLRWAEVPCQVRAAAESALGAAVTADAPQAGGFSPGLASRLTLADGRRVFAKAVSGGQNPRSPGLYRRETEVARALPERVPAPRLRWSYDDGDWVMLVFDDVDGVMPATPWRQEEFSRVMAALERLAEVLTPAPAGAVPIAGDLAENFRSWRVIAADPALAGRLDGWERANLPRLADLESRWQVAARGDPAAADAVLAAAAGDFTLQSLLPPPPNLPSLRGHQRRKAAAATGWLRSRVSWP